MPVRDRPAQARPELVDNFHLGADEHRRLDAVFVHGVKTGGDELVRVVNGVGDDRARIVQVTGPAEKANRGAGNGFSKVLGPDSQPLEGTAFENPNRPGLGGVVLGDSL